MSNKLIGTVCGWVAQDAEVKEKNVTFSLAINRGVKNHETGKWTETAMWVRCTDWLVDRSSKLAKGALVCVTGEITWDAHKSGEKSAFYAPQLKVCNLDILKWANNENDKSTTREHAKGQRGGEDLPF